MNAGADVLLTIIIPCYNAEKYINRCVSCLEGIDESCVLILFINDGSTDLTAKLLGDWITAHDNARIVSKVNGGYSSAINAGLDNCTTEYIMFMGVDDEIVSDEVNEICQHLKKNKPDMLAFSTVKQYDDIENRQNELDSLTKYNHPGVYIGNITSVFSKIGKDTAILFTRDTSRCYKMSAVRDLRYFGKTGISADGCFSSLVASRANSFEFINKTAYVWHVHQDSVSGGEKTIEKIKEEADVWQQYFCVMKDSISDDRITDYVVDQLFMYLRLIDVLELAGEISYANKHELEVKRNFEWLKGNKFISLKSKIKIYFPSLYLKIKLYK